MKALFLTVTSGSCLNGVKESETSLPHVLLYFENQESQKRDTTLN